MTSNKQLQRTVQTTSRRGARASFHYARAPRITRQRAAAELRRSATTQTQRSRRWAVMAAIAMGFAMVMPSAASGCTVGHVATAQEIAREADVILRAKAIRFEPERGAGDDHGDFVFEVVEVLKGRFQDGILTLFGTTAYKGANDRAPPYDWVRPGGRDGGCFAFDYEVGTQFLLFFKDGTVHWSPLAATNEPLLRNNDPWLTWVREFLRAEVLETQ